MEQKQKKILVVEDDPAMREIVSHKLLSHGFAVLQAEDGKVAIERFAQEHPDLVLLDLLLPEIDGFHVLQKIRTNPDRNLAQTPVIVLSNLWSNKDILNIQALKADDFMVKAYFTTEEILTKINEVLHKRQEEAAK